MWANVCLLVWEAKGDRAAGEHHQRERGLGGVEPVGAPGDEPHLVVERVNPSVVDAKADRGEDALTVGADGAGEFDERFQPAAGGLDAPAVEQLGRLAGCEVAGEDRPQGLLEPIGAPGRTAVAAQLAQGGGLGVGQTLGALEQHPAGAFELLGLVRVHSAQLVPDLSADLVERVAGGGDDVERVGAHGRGGGVARLGHRLQVGRSHVSGDGGKLGCAVGAQRGEELAAGGGVLALGAPHLLAGAMVGDQGEVAVPLTPGHLVDADLEQLLQPARVELVGDHPGTDRPDRLPGDPHQPADRGLVHPGGQPRDQVLKVAGEARLDPGERHALGAHPMGGAVDPAQFGPHDQPQAAKVQVPPAGVDRAGVVAGPAGVGAVRAGEPAAAQRDRDGDLRRLERDVAHRGTRKGEQAVECSSDAHGRWTSGLGLGHLQPYGLACARHPSRSQHLVGVVLPASPSAKDPRRTHIQFRSPEFSWDVVEGTHEPSSAVETAEARPRWRFSLAGVALKFSMLAVDDRLTLPAFGEGGDWIVKLPDPQYPEVPRNEYAMMSLAAMSGIDVPEIRLIHRDELKGLPPSVWPGREEWAYAVRRFDRAGRSRRVHIEDLAQVRNIYPEAKYSGNYETVAALVYRGRDAEALREFARRLAFTILIANGDGHLKNWSLIYRDARTPTLSPAYDLVATAPYREHLTDQETLALKFGGSRRFRSVRLTTFTRLQHRLSAPTADLAGCVSELVDRVRVNWPRFANQLGDFPWLHNAITASIDENSRSLRD